MSALPAHDCDVCGARVSELRRGRCWGCYARWVDARPVGLGARCVVCNERRRRLLRSVELHGAWYPLCFACAGQAMALEPLPATIAALRTALQRDRRRVDRRVGKPDTRVFQYERRIGQRRVGRDEVMLVDDDMLVEITVETVEESPEPSGSGDTPVVFIPPAAADAEIDFDDLTRIRELI